MSHLSRIILALAWFSELWQQNYENNQHFTFTKLHKGMELFNSVSKVSGLESSVELRKYLIQHN